MLTLPPKLMVSLCEYTGIWCYVLILVGHGTSGFGIGEPCYWRGRCVRWVQAILNHFLRTDYETYPGIL